MRELQEQATADTSEVRHLDPRTLLVDMKIRHRTDLDKEFVDSIKDHGVLQAIVAVRTADEQIRVRFGHRRALAAVAAGLPTVPVIVCGNEATDDEGHIQRLVGQWAENEHRAALTNAERVDAIGQLAAFGVSAAQIAKRTKTSRDHVAAALRIMGSDLAKAATARYDWLDLAQSAIVAEVQDNTEDVKALVAAAKTGQFDHVAQRIRDRRAEHALIQAKATELRAAGMTVIDRREMNRDQDRTLASLSEQRGGDELDPITHHQACPGHAVYLEDAGDWMPIADVPDGWTWEPDPDDEENENGEDPVDDQTREVWAHGLSAVPLCRDYRAHGHIYRWGPDRTTPHPGDPVDDAERQRKRAERRDTIESNKAWRSAETVRREFVTTLLTRKTPPKGAVTYVAREYAEAGHELRTAMERGHSQARAFLGLPAEDNGPLWGFRDGAATIVALLDGVTDARAQVITLAMILGAQESATGVHSRRTSNPATLRYLTFLAEQGYALSDVEHRACGLPPHPEHDNN